MLASTQSVKEDNRGGFIMGARAGARAGARSKKTPAVEAVRALTTELRATLGFLNGRRTIMELETERGTMVQVCGMVSFTNGPDDGIRDDRNGTFYPFDKYAVTRFL